MNKIKELIIILTIVFLIPLNVFASSDEKINVYIFKGEGCGYCAKALTFLKGLDSEYQSYFNLVEKEVWYDTDNATLMQSVASYLGDTLNGVPYIVIGNKTFNGYNSSYDDDIKSAIKSAYENTDNSYQDIVAEVISESANTSDEEDDAEETSTVTLKEYASDDEEIDNSIVVVVVIIAGILGISFLAYMAQDNNKKNKAN
jgi:glutaredoxin